MAKPEEIIASVDPSLTFIATFDVERHPWVFHVKDLEVDRVLKVYGPPDDLSRYQLRKAARNMDLLNEVQGIAHLIRVYSDGYWLGILREYCQGNTLADIAHQPSLKSLEVLAAIVQTIHCHGIAGLDISGQNVILTPDGTPVLIDLDTGELEAEVNDFGIYVLSDWVQLQRFDEIHRMNVAPYSPVEQSL